MRTTPEDRDSLRRTFSQFYDSTGPLIHRLLDDFAELEAELAALRRVEVENLCAWRLCESWAQSAHWMVGDAECGACSDGQTLAAALADYDAKKAGSHG